MKAPPEQWSATMVRGAVAIERVPRGPGRPLFATDLVALVGPPVGLGYNRIPLREAEALGRLIAAAPALRAALEAVEWGADTPAEGRAEFESACPWCDSAKRLGHADTCGLAAALRLAGPTAALDESTEGKDRVEV